MFAKTMVRGLLTAVATVALLGGTAMANPITYNLISYSLSGSITTDENRSGLLSPVT